MIEKSSLPPSWKKNVMHCVETVKLSIIWNGKNLEWFNHIKGIRQGDPISPYMFVLCMECLDHVIDQAILEGIWKPIMLS